MVPKKILPNGVLKGMGMSICLGSGTETKEQDRGRRIYVWVLHAKIVWGGPGH